MMPSGVDCVNRNPDHVVVPPTMKDPYDDLAKLINGRTIPDKVAKIISRDSGVSGQAIPMGLLSNMKLK